MPPSVSVPVLSTQTTSTRARISTAGCSWMSTCSRASFRAATAKEMVVISARPCGIMLVTAATEATSAGSRATSRGFARAWDQPPKACTWPWTITATIGTRAIVIQEATFSRAPRSSEEILVKRRACAASFEACESAPTAVARTRPVPAITAEPESTVSPGCFGTASDSPVSRDSSRSRPSEDRTSPSTGTWSPRRRATRSSSTTSARATVCREPSRTTVAPSWCSSAIRSSFRFAEYSCTTPMTTLATAARQNSRSSQRPRAMITAADRPMVRLKSVRTWTRRIVSSDRDVSSGWALVCPAATRSATCADVRPCSAAIRAVPSCGLGQACPPGPHRRGGPVTHSIHGTGPPYPTQG